MSAPGEQNYDTYDVEQLVVSETPKQCWHYLTGANHKILIRCHNKNLEYFLTSGKLSRRQARWSETLSSYNFPIEGPEGGMNPDDGPSRRPDYEIGYERPVAWPLATISVELSDDLMPVFIMAQADNPLAANISAKLVDRPIADGVETLGEENEGNIVPGALTYQGSIYIPVVDSVPGKVISLLHHNPESSHFADLKTAEPESGNFHCPAMDSYEGNYVGRYEVCHRNNVACPARY